MNITFDFSALAGLAAQMRDVGASQIGLSALEVVNRVTTRFDKEQRAAQIADINLPRSYVDSVTRRVAAATPVNPRAEIRTERKLTVMDRYGAAPYRRPNDTDRLGRRLGNRQGGVLLPIKPSAPRREDAMFMLPLRNQAGRQGVFVRTTATGGRPKHLYGPSPYSLFRFQVRRSEADLVQTLAREALESLSAAIEKGLSK